MERIFIYLQIVFVAFLVCPDVGAQEVPIIQTGSRSPMPYSWIDQSTGHRIKHMLPQGGDNRSFYFNNNPFIPGKAQLPSYMIFYRRVKGQKGRQLFAVDTKTKRLKQLTNQPFVSGEIVSATTRQVFFQCRDSIYTTNVDSGSRQLLYVFPDSIQGSIYTVNSDGTTLAGVINTKKEQELFKKHPTKQSYFDLIYSKKLKRTLFTLTIATGQVKRIFSDHAWLNHLQFSPTDPTLLMFCHEGPWHKVDRIWTIRTNVKNAKPILMHHRSMDMEIAGHEFFSPDGQTIWYDLQKPRSTNFYLGGTNVKTLEEKTYRLSRNEWSIHYNISPDQKQFAGDGGDSGQVAKAKDGMWIYLFQPDGNHFNAEKLVNMKNHDYHLEPNVRFSPDGKWIIFRANFEGHSDIYEVELKKQ